MQLLGLESLNIIKALNRTACLIANHGQVAFGKFKAFELAQEIENICHQYEMPRIGIPKILEKEMKIVLKI